MNDALDTIAEYMSAFIDTSVVPPRISREGARQLCTQFATLLNKPYAEVAAALSASTCLSIQELPAILERSQTVRLQWSEPRTGVDEEGQEVTVPVDLSATAEGCVRMERHKRRCARPSITDVPEDVLLADFFTVHWALV